MKVSLTYNGINHGEMISSLYRKDCGAVVTFFGIVKKKIRNRTVVSLEYTAYEEMALAELNEVVIEAEKKYGLKDAIVIHRLGKMKPLDLSVFIGVTSPHRKEAFEGCRFIIDRIKKRVPIWKKEFYSDGSSWIEEGIPEDTL